ncbi:hypothetical protein SAMN05192583_0975 [Sphingomonas gellani]|uniref:Uncharacterized protein n=1 Tax=Sphingomonas gellani TaxID=1166340 RepID=A0A1H8AMV7_9SPHN|nr:hypothetical protein [Sphingomonas gellani]SEM71853.1 hypothetical protein SAMN05192583_0975 [Sphingomonas gellani]
MATGAIWMTVVFVGAFVLLAAIIWAKSKNKTSDRQRRETEAATKRLYEEGTTDESTLNRS